jgi:hypothetical protein
MSDRELCLFCEQEQCDHDFACAERTWLRLTRDVAVMRANCTALQADLDQANQTIDDLRDRGIK